jgi:hypothetical protein
MKEEFFFGILVCMWLVQAQTLQDIQLADQYLRNTEFDKAVVLMKNSGIKVPAIRNSSRITWRA